MTTPLPPEQTIQEISDNLTAIKKHYGIEDPFEAMEKLAELKVTKLYDDGKFDELRDLCINLAKERVKNMQTAILAEKREKEDSEMAFNNLEEAVNDLGFTLKGTPIDPESNFTVE